MLSFYGHVEELEWAVADASEAPVSPSWLLQSPGQTPPISSGSENHVDYNYMHLLNHRKAKPTPISFHWREGSHG